MPETHSPASTRPVLSVSNLTTALRQRDGGFQTIIDDITFDIAPKETLAIVGESGSGKSVTALSIMRLLGGKSSRISGRVELAGRNLLDLTEPQMRAIRGNDIAMIFQEPMTSLNPLMTVGAQITEVLIRHRGMTQTEARRESLHMLERVRIPEARARLDEYPHRLSGGMRQRVMIAMALVCKPRLLIADEPTTALDVTIQAQTLALMKILQEEEGMGILFITHDMGVVSEVADRTLVMLRGKAVERGSTAELFASPRHSYARALLAAVPTLGTMEGVALPQRFPAIDQVTGKAALPPPPVDTVSADEPPVLRVRNLTTRYAVGRRLIGGPKFAIHAVENVSFDLRKGETLALVGESGCGKSTLGRSVLRLVEPKSGEIQLQGTDIRKLDTTGLRRMRRSAQLIFQDPYASLDPRYRVGTTIAEPILAHGLASRAEAQERVARLLERVGLSADAANRYPHEFSGGQRQRISIARALSLEPAMIVADEAVSALDVSIKAQVLNLMLDLQESLRLAYLFISHDMAVVERISHRVAVMYLGEVVEIGPRNAVFGNPQHPYTRKLLAAVPKLEPSRRDRKPMLSNDEIPSPIRAAGYEPPKRSYRMAGTDHFVCEN
ncbi:ABC transporter ATP-binding protein [Paracoccus onubensis]|uniref:Glutathione import ATP-binding protein GsiA n=1 Tax=Paracoccus onubensis TaxID=1675788 RepID=A0A418SUE7_9RHOB|nr:ABC transporter ATP-binding protein [Paracoccus onubensis]